MDSDERARRCWHLVATIVVCVTVTTRAGGSTGFDRVDASRCWAISLTPLRHEIERKSGSFLSALSEADALLREGRERRAIARVLRAIEEVLIVRERVLAPMRRSQNALEQQVIQAHRSLQSLANAYQRRFPEGRLTVAAAGSTVGSRWAPATRALTAFAELTHAHGALLRQVEELRRTSGRRN